MSVTHDHHAAAALLGDRALIPNVGIVRDDGARAASAMKLGDRLSVPVTNKHVVAVNHHVVIFSSIHQHANVPAVRWTARLLRHCSSSSDVVHGAEVSAVALVEGVWNARRVSVFVLFNNSEKYPLRIRCFPEQVFDCDDTLDVSEGSDAEKNCLEIILLPLFVEFVRSPIKPSQMRRFAGQKLELMRSSKWQWLVTITIIIITTTSNIVRCCGRNVDDSRENDNQRDKKMTHFFFFLLIGENGVLFLFYFIFEQGKLDLVNYYYFFYFILFNCVSIESNGIFFFPLLVRNNI